MVHRAVRGDDGSVVAAKLLNPARVPPDVCDSIMHEVSLLRNLSHPNIVKYIAYIRTGQTAAGAPGRLCILLEYCEAGSLGAMCKKYGGIPEELAAVYVAQVLEGLAYLHAQGIIHRDIKGDNILMTRAGTVKVADFGVATRSKVLGTGGTTGGGGGNAPAYAAGTVVGTPHFMAPEIIEMKGALSATDVWSLGATVVELLTGRPPYADRGSMATVYAIVTDDHPPLPDGISARAKDFLMECFRKEPRMRPSARRLLRHPWITSNLKKQQKKKAELKSGGESVNSSAATTTARYDDAVKSVLDWNKALRGEHPSTPAVAAKPAASIDLSRRESRDDGDTWTDDFPDFPDDISGRLQRFHRSSAVLPAALPPLAPPKPAATASPTASTPTRERDFTSENSPHRETGGGDDFSDLEGEIDISKLHSRSPSAVGAGRRDSRLPLPPGDVLGEHRTFLPTAFPSLKRAPLNTSSEPRRVTPGTPPLEAVPLDTPLEDDDSDADDDTFEEAEDDDEDDDGSAGRTAVLQDKVHLRQLAEANAQVAAVVAELRRAAAAGAGAPDDALAGHLDALLGVLRAHPAARAGLVRANALQPIVDVLRAAAADSPPVLRRVLDVLALTLGAPSVPGGVGAGAAAPLADRFCLLGGVPVLLGAVAQEHAPAVRYRAAALLAALVGGGQAVGGSASPAPAATGTAGGAGGYNRLAVDILLSCGGLHVFAQLVAEDCEEHEALVRVGVEGIAAAFGVEGPRLNDEMGVQLAQHEIVGSLVFALGHFLRKQEQAATDAESARVVDKIVSFFAAFARMGSHVKEALISIMIVRELFKVYRRLGAGQGNGGAVHRLQVLRFVRAVSGAPKTLDTLQHAHATEFLVSVLRDASAAVAGSTPESADAEGARAWLHSAADQVLPTLENLARLSTPRQEELVMLGAAPLLLEAATLSPTLRDTCAAVLSGATHVRRSSRRALLAAGVLRFFLAEAAGTTGSTGSAQATAYDVVATWLAADPGAVEPLLLADGVPARLVGGLRAAALAAVFEHFGDALGRSARLCAAVAREPAFYDVLRGALERPWPARRGEAKAAVPGAGSVPRGGVHQQASAAISQLKVVRAVLDNGDEEEGRDGDGGVRARCAESGLLGAVEALARRHDQVVLSELAKEVLEKMRGGGGSVRQHVSLSRAGSMSTPSTTSTNSAGTIPGLPQGASPSGPWRQRSSGGGGGSNGLPKSTSSGSLLRDGAGFGFSSTFSFSGGAGHGMAPLTENVSPSSSFMHLSTGGSGSGTTLFDGSGDAGTPRASLAQQNYHRHARGSSSASSSSGTGLTRSHTKSDFSYHRHSASLGGSADLALAKDPPSIPSSPGPATVTTPSSASRHRKAASISTFEPFASPQPQPQMPGTPTPRRTNSYLRRYTQQSRGTLTPSGKGLESDAAGGHRRHSHALPHSLSYNSGLASVLKPVSANAAAAQQQQQQQHAGPAVGTGRPGKVRVSGAGGGVDGLTGAAAALASVAEG